ncbi:enoyl-CoA hydratase-related protein [Gaoshiqia sediminis]|uniref:Enoyl-CoA hydratase-related protein n=1 Tax=Gaoshiqia sediminis TaxID=2986998 RepID=A0AA42C559_9BACT|nr:enoyl-CoA hydratase-related protein [Gaoshiqia sediminis]MCW0482463.1 enoyl-CoA hydratase-related protein [Gaoshiqia sediminis]
MEKFKYIKLEKSGVQATILLDRPKQHNALNPEMIEELHTVLDHLAEDEMVHFVVLAGEGESFCAGADINWFAGAVDRGKAENWQEFLRMAELMKKLATFPKITIAAAHRNVLGGANGLLAACDFSLAEKSTGFAFGEVKLGIIPATILPFVARRLSTQHLKKLMFSGERFGAVEAHAIGLVDFLAEDGKRMEVVDKLIGELKAVSPNALKACKQLILKVETGEVGLDSSEYTAAVLAELVHSDEGQEGLRAFLEKRKPDWKGASLLTGLHKQ